MVGARLILDATAKRAIRKPDYSYECRTGDNLLNGSWIAPEQMGRVTAGEADLFADPLRILGMNRIQEKVCGSNIYGCLARASV